MPVASAARLLLLPAALVLLGGCEWFSTMSDPAAIQPHEREPWPPPERSVPLDGLPEFDLSNVDEVLTTNPRPADSTSIAIGEAYYDAFCTVCHGRTGLGNGPISDKFPAIPSIVTPSVAGRTDAYLFALITQGRGLMPEYSRIPKSARWDVVNYVRDLGERVGAEGAPVDTTAGGMGGAGGQIGATPDTTEPGGTP